MRNKLCAAVVAVALCGSAVATSSVSFDAQGYVVDIVVGGDSRPAIASLGIATPSSARSIAIPMRHLKVEAFDTAQKTLLLRFVNPGDPALPAGFSLTVRGDDGVLQIDGKSMAGRFSWGQ